MSLFILSASNYVEKITKLFLSQRKAFHQITKTILFNNIQIQCKHGRHHWSPRLNPMAIDFKKPRCHIPILFIPHMKDLPVGDSYLAKCGAGWQFIEVKPIDIR